MAKTEVQILRTVKLLTKCIDKLGQEETVKILNAAIEEKPDHTDKIEKIINKVCEIVSKRKAIDKDVLLVGIYKKDRGDISTCRRLCVLMLSKHVRIKGTAINRHFCRQQSGYVDVIKRWHRKLSNAERKDVYMKDFLDMYNQCDNEVIKLLS